MAHPLTRKEIKKPDEFQVAATRALDWSIAHSRHLAIGAAALGVLAVIAVVATRNAAAEEARVGHSLSNALAMAARPVIKGESAAAVPPENRSYFQSTEEKAKVVGEALLQIRADVPEGPARWLATFQLATVRAEEGKPADAIALYEEALTGAPAEDPLRPSILEGLGYAHENAGGEGWFEKADAVFERLAGEANMPERARYHHARLLEKAGKKDEARAAFESIGKDYPQAALAQTAQERLTLMDLPPPPPKAGPPPPAKVKAPAKARGK